MTAPPLKSSDFDQDPKSFTLDTGDGYFIRPTVAYVKGTPAEDPVAGQGQKNDSC